MSSRNPSSGTNLCCFSQAINWELSWKWNNCELNWDPYDMPESQAEALLTMLQHQPLKLLKFLVNGSPFLNTSFRGFSSGSLLALNAARTPGLRFVSRGSFCSITLSKCSLSGSPKSLLRSTQWLPSSANHTVDCVKDPLCCGSAWPRVLQWQLRVATHPVLEGDWGMLGVECS